MLSLIVRCSREGNNQQKPRGKPERANQPQTQVHVAPFSVSAQPVHHFLPERDSCWAVMCALRIDRVWWVGNKNSFLFDAIYVLEVLLSIKRVGKQWSSRAHTWKYQWIQYFLLNHSYVLLPREAVERMRLSAGFPSFWGLYVTWNRLNRVEWQRWCWWVHWKYV